MFWLEFIEDQKSALGAGLASPSHWRQPEITKFQSPTVWPQLNLSLHVATLQCYLGFPCVVHDASLVSEGVELQEKQNMK